MVISINPRLECYQHFSDKVRKARSRRLIPQAGLWAL